jgi:hypothetical protein
VHTALEKITLADLAKPIDPAGPFIPLVGMDGDKLDRTASDTKALE